MKKLVLLRFGQGNIIMKVTDTRGQLCPAPLIATKRTLKETANGESFKVITDNKTSLENISRFLKDNKTGFSVTEESGVWTLTIVKGESAGTSVEAEEYCTNSIPHFNLGDFIIAITSDKMGEGDDDLGRLLMGNFIKAIKDLDVLPEKIVFYNGGVKLGIKESPVFDQLREMEKMGIQLLFCATCIKHYSLEKKVSIGILSNMFEIAQAMSSASNVVKP